jgi:pilus assembly protein CpaC
MTSRYLPALLLATSLALSGPAAQAARRPVARAVPATATDQAFSQTLAPDTSRTLHFTSPIARVEVDKEGVVAVRAPDARSIVLTGLAPGDAIVKVYAADGAVVSSGVVSVVPARLAASDALAQDPRMSRVVARQQGKEVVLTGSVDSLAAHAAAPLIASAAGDSPAVNYTNVSGEQVVAVDVQFVAVSSTTLNALGFNFSKLSGDIQGAVVSPSSLSSYAFNSSGLTLGASAPLQSAFNLFLGSTNHGIGAVMSALASNGLSQVLAQPTLLVRSGEEAHFLAGGEIPIPVPQGITGGTGGGGTVTIQFKEFGVRLSVAPTVLDHGRIVLKIAPEVSELDYTNGVQIQGFTVPGIKRRSADTTVQLGNGQSFVIAGLSYTNNTVTKNKTPLLGDLPVLGAFFRNQQSQKERQELIIVATPRLVSPLKAETAAGMIANINGEAPELTIRDMILGANDTDLKDVTFGVVRR